MASYRVVDGKRILHSKTHIPGIDDQQELPEADTPEQPDEVEAEEAEVESSTNEEGE